MEWQPIKTAMRRIRDWIALLFIRLAKRFTTWGEPYDRLCEAETEQKIWMSLP